MRALDLLRKTWPRRLTSWGEWYAAAAVLGGGGLLILFGDRLTLGPKVAGAVLLFLFLVVGLRRGWVKLFGPVLFYDLVRTARGSRSFLLRGIYATALLVMLFLGYSEWFASSPTQWMDVFSSENYIPPSQAAYFAEDFFTSFLVVQIGMVFLLTPVYTATAIAEEKERRTLDFLLATDLRGREIVLGKLASRLAHLSLFILTGLPILGFLQLMGGVDPNLVLVAFAGTALTMLSLASLGILNSAYFDRPRTAIFFTYLQAGAFLLFSYPVPGLRYGNLFAAWHDLMLAAAAGGLTKAAPGVLRAYALFHGLIAILCCAWAGARLHAWNRFRLSPRAEPPILRIVAADGTTVLLRQPTIWPNGPLPPLRRNPLLWKEMHFDSGRRWGPAARATLAFLTILGCTLALFSFLLGLAVVLGTSPVSEFTNIWVRILGTATASLLLVAVAIRAAVAISGERERQTLDGLLALPCDDHAILWAKGWGSILSVRRGWWCLGFIWILGMVFRGLDPLATPLLAASWLAHAALLSGVGVWFSLVSRTTLRASMYTVLFMAAIYLGPFLIGLVTDPLWIAFGWKHEPDWFESFRSCGIAAPASFWVLARDPRDLDHPYFDYRDQFPAAMLGILGAASAAVAIWGLIWLRFARVTGRMNANGVPVPRDRTRVLDLIPPDLAASNPQEFSSAATPTCPPSLPVARD